MKKRLNLGKHTHIYNTSNVICTYSDKEIFRGQHVFFEGCRYKVVSVLRNERPLKAFRSYARRYFEFRANKIEQPK